jgi:hypothetical protein
VSEWKRSRRLRRACQKAKTGEEHQTWTDAYPVRARRAVLSSFQIRRSLSVELVPRRALCQEK